jgi:hypothetical protein
MPPFLNMRRFSRSSSVHNPQAPQSPPTSFTPPLSHAPMMPNGTSGSHHDSHSRPVSANTSSSFDFANRPPTQYQMSALPSNVVGNLSRTDQIVLRHFWDVKHEENKSRDLHFVSGVNPSLPPVLLHVTPAANRRRNSSNFHSSLNIPRTKTSFRIARSITWSRLRQVQRSSAWAAPTMASI